MARFEAGVRRAIVGALGAAGAYYAAVGAVVLLNVEKATQRWISASGDPDFPADAARFGIAIGAGAAIFLILGAGTALSAIRALSGRAVGRRSLVAMAGWAVMIHIPWLFYKHIETGTLPRLEAAGQFRPALWQFAGVCLLYLAGAAAMWSWPVRRKVA